MAEQILAQCRVESQSPLTFSVSATCLPWSRLRASSGPFSFSVGTPEFDSLRYISCYIWYFAIRETGEKNKSRHESMLIFLCIQTQLLHNSKTLMCTQRMVGLHEMWERENYRVLLQITLSINLILKTILKVRIDTAIFPNITCEKVFLNDLFYNFLPYFGI